MLKVEVSRTLRKKNVLVLVGVGRVQEVDEPTEDGRGRIRRRYWNHGESWFREVKDVSEVEALAKEALEVTLHNLTLPAVHLGLNEILYGRGEIESYLLERSRSLGL